MLIVFVLSDGTIAPDGWRTGCELPAAREHARTLTVPCRRHHRAAHHRGDPARRVHLVGALPRAQAGRALARVVDAAAGDARVAVGARARQARGDARARAARVQRVHELRVLDPAVLPELPGPEPRADDGAPAADVRHGRDLQRDRRAVRRPRAARLPRRYVFPRLRGFVSLSRLID